MIWANKIPWLFRNFSDKIPWIFLKISNTQICWLLLAWLLGNIILCMLSGNWQLSIHVSIWQTDWKTHIGHTNRHTGNIKASAALSILKCSLLAPHPSWLKWPIYLTVADILTTLQHNHDRMSFEDTMDYKLW